MRFRAPVPLIFRPLGLKLTIRPPYLGTVLEASRIALESKLDEKLPCLAATPAALAETAEPLARVAAIALLRGKWRIRLFTGLVTRYLLWGVTPKGLFDLYTAIRSQWGVEDFISTTGWVVAQAETLLGPNVKGSHETASADSIAPSDSSEASNATAD